ncbi:hypothetical protein VL14_15500 [Cytobacillus firmus]|nr:hypothetical protein VL14_15500 [Cytobacillus firmus]
MLVFILHFPLNKWLFSQGLLLFCILFTELIGEEGARSSKMPFAFSSCGVSRGNFIHRLPRCLLSSLERKSTDNIER